MATHVLEPSAAPDVRPRRRGLPGPAPRPAAERFARHCEVLPNGCKRWLGGSVFSLSGGGAGLARPQVAAYRLLTGEGPRVGSPVIATCGYEACVEGTHLRRSRRGEFGRLSPEAIVAAVRAGETYEAIGVRAGLSRQRIHQVVRHYMVACQACAGTGKVLPTATPPA